MCKIWCYSPCVLNMLMFDVALERNVDVCCHDRCGFLLFQVLKFKLGFVSSVKICCLCRSEDLHLQLPFILTDQHLSHLSQSEASELWTKVCGLFLCSVNRWDVLHTAICQQGHLYSSVWMWGLKKIQVPTRYQKLNMSVSEIC